MVLFLVGLNGHNKIPQTEWLTQQKFIPQFGNLKSRMEVPAHLFSSEGCLPGFQVDSFSLCLYTVFSSCAWKERFSSS